jgi:holo-[acyl-carrier protein] synthase
MSVIALGIDLVEVGRIRDLLERHGLRFKERTFSAGERAYCDANADPAMSYAARFAAKEAVAKALGTGFAEGVSWNDIEVLRAESGEPSIALHKGARKRAKDLGITKVLVTLTHTKDTAAASVVALGKAE